MIPLLMCCCQSHTVQRLMKARAVTVSPFLDKRGEMVPARKRLPMHCAWRNFDLATQQEVMQRNKLYIAPVSLKHLQPLKKDVAQWEVDHGWAKRNETEMASELKSRFEQAFLKSPKPRYQLVNAPGPDTMTLELAITQLSPTSVGGNLVKTASKYFIGPLSAVFSIFTKGNIAIEGKVSISDTKTSVLQFADNEKDKATLYTFRDFRPYGHALISMDEWGRQFEEFTRTHGQHKVGESSFFTLKPW